MDAALHPRDALFDPGEPVPASLPVCDHYAGVEARMRKSLELQAEMGPVFDVTLDAEDGAPVGGELEHGALIAEMVNSPQNRFGRVGARLLPVEHPQFEALTHLVVGAAGARLAYLMLPKVRGLADLRAAVAVIDAVPLHEAPGRSQGSSTPSGGLTRSGRVGGAQGRPIPLQALIETHGALHEVFELAAHPRIESLSFGLMDFVSAHRGAIPLSAMSVKGQFEHPLVVRAKLQIAAACHAHGKAPSHCVVTEFRHPSALQEAATRACRQFGYTRMWSIHPSQIRPIVDAFTPTTAEVDLAIEIISAAQAARWAPIKHHDTLHDRASYRYFWHLLERAHRTSYTGGPQLPEEVRRAFFGDR